MGDEVTVSIDCEADILAARQCARELAVAAGFDNSDLVLIVTAVSELARNIVQHAKQGLMTFAPLANGKRGLSVVAEDSGPGIPDLELAMQDGYSTGGGLGLGLPGARRLMDEFEITSARGSGTRVLATKWKR